MMARFTASSTILICLALIQGGCGLLEGLFSRPKPQPTVIPVPSPTGSPDFPIREARTRLGELLELARIRPHFEPGSLVHEGVGIFSIGDTTEPDFPARWGRSYPRGIQGQTPVIDRMSVTFLQEVPEVVTAQATFSLERTGTWLADYPLQRRLVRKPFRDRAIRHARFVRGDAGWNLTEISPFTLGTVSGGISVDTIQVRPEGGKPFSGSPERLAPWSAYPRIRTGQMLEVKVQLATGTPAAGCHVFASFPPLRDRILLRDDGLDGDVLSGDGSFGGRFQVPGPLPDVPQLVFDVVSMKTLTDPESPECDSLLVGIPIAIDSDGGTP